MKQKIIKKNILSVMILIVFSLFLIQNINAEQNNTLDIHVFVGETCPHCAELEEYLDSLKQEYDYINPIYYEVWYNNENRALFEQMSKEQGIEIKGVPTAFVGDSFFEGYSPRMNQDIINIINSQSSENNQINNSVSGNLSEINPNLFKIPFFGEINLNKISLPVITVLLGFLDGFNPCAFFVLLFLLSLLIYAGSRKRMLIIGLTFVFFSGLIYFLFMAAWLNFFIVTKNLKYITTFAGVIALIISGINIKDFFAFKKGVSLSVSDKHKSNLISRMRSLLKEDSMFSMMIGTITLAIAANLYELLCTAGFPMVFTKILVLNELNILNYYLYLLFYNIVYIIPLLTIVLIFTYNFGAKKLSESQGQTLKLLSGMMMLALGSILVFNPGLLNNIFYAIGIITLAIILTGIILIIKKKFSNKQKEVNEDEI